MTNYDVTIYNSLYEAEQALEGIDNAINIVAIPFKDGVLTKILLLTGIGEQLEQTISDLTVEITATSVTEGASIKIQGTSDNVNYGDLHSLNLLNCMSMLTQHLPVYQVKTHG